MIGIDWSGSATENFTSEKRDASLEIDCLFVDGDLLDFYTELYAEAAQS